MKYNALVVCQNSSDRKPKPFIVSVYSYFDKDVVISDLERFKKIYKNTDIKILSSWIEKIEIEFPTTWIDSKGTGKLTDYKEFKIYVRTNKQQKVGDYIFVGKYKNAEDTKEIYDYYKNKDFVDDVKIETIDYKELFYKKICENYIKTMDTQVLLQNPKNNNSIIHACIADEAIDLKEKGKINVQNYKEYLKDKDFISKYDTYEQFYESFVKDFIIAEIRALGLFKGEKNKWDFYISYNDMILLGMENEIKKSMENEFAEEYEKGTDLEEEQ